MASEACINNVRSMIDRRPILRYYKFLGYKLMIWRNKK